MTTTSEANKVVATRFIEAFNTDDWDTVREIVGAEFIFHHPEGGTVAAGPEGMIAAWSAFKAAVPDGWHPIPVLIAEGDYVANLLPTYGHFNGESYHGIPPTGRWLEYGMVNIARLRDGQIVEAWFGMDPLAEKQQMGVAPSTPRRRLSEQEAENIALFHRSFNTTGEEYDNVTAFDDVVVALGPPQRSRDTKRRSLEMYHIGDGALTLMRSHEFSTIPPYAGDLAADTEESRALVTRYFEEVLVGHDVDVLSDVVSAELLIHATAMPCEASHHGVDGARDWLGLMWEAFPDLTIDEYTTVATGDIVAVHWKAHGTSEGRFMHLEPTGKRIQFSGASMFRIEENRIAEIWDAKNTLAIMFQLDPGMARPHHLH